MPRRRLLGGFARRPFGIFFIGRRWIQVKLQSWQKETNALDVLEPRGQIDFLIITRFPDRKLYGQVAYVSRENGSRKNERKMWDVFLK